MTATDFCSFSRFSHHENPENSSLPSQEQPSQRPLPNTDQAVAKPAKDTPSGGAGGTEGISRWPKGTHPERWHEDLGRASSLPAHGVHPVVVGFRWFRSFVASPRAPTF